MCSILNSHNLKIVFLGSILALCGGCDQIFEEDLSGKCVSIIAPSDSLQTSISTIQFDWEELDGATGYRVQIARPGFDDIEQLIFDSLVATTRATVSLYPGTFQWRIRPENTSSEGQYITRTLSIDSTLDLSSQEIILISPTNNFATNQTSMSFSWYQLYNADQYSFLIKNDDWNGSLALPEVLTTSTSITLEDIPEGKYSWGVRGEADLSNTPYSNYALWVDFTAPGIPTLTAPANNATVTGDFNLTWTRPADTGSALEDSLYIYSDESLTTIVSAVKTAEATYLENLSAGTYYWRVKCLDIAGNAGSFSTSRVFIVQ